jgi:hypothetical protein
MDSHATLVMIRKWEDLFLALYKRKPKLIEREQFLFGILFYQVERMEEMVK